MSEMRTLPSVARLRELFELTADGRLWNRVTRNGRAQAGQEAGSVNGNGYRRVKVDGVRLLVHRAIYAMATGVYPLMQIDHIDGDRSNNLPANLRDVSNALNGQNQRGARPDSSTGLLGASPSLGGFRAHIRVNGRTRFLGRFATAEEAHAAYLAAKRILHQGCTI